jgi:hypothetical protein
MKRVLRLPLAMAGTIALGLAPWSTVSQATAKSVQQIAARRSGTMDFVWQDGHKLLGLSSRAVLEDGRSLTTTAYVQHDLESSNGNESSLAFLIFSGERFLREPRGLCRSGNIPCRGVPQTGHASARRVISAPQHVQKAAIQPP